MKQRQAVTKVTAKRYQQAGKKVKKQILDEFCRTTSYHRCYARWVLRHQGQRVQIKPTLVLEGDVQQRQRRPKARIYDDRVIIGDALPPERRAMGFTVQSILKRVPTVIAPIVGGVVITRLGVFRGVHA